MFLKNYVTNQYFRRFEDGPLAFQPSNFEGRGYVCLYSLCFKNKSFPIWHIFSRITYCNVNFYNWPRPYQWANRGDSVHMSFRVILFDCITGMNLNDIQFHHHLSLRKSEPEVERKMKREKFSLWNDLHVFKGLHMSVKIIPEHSSLKGSNRFQVSFCCENTNVKLMGKFSGICCQWFEIHFRAKLLQSKDNHCFEETIKTFLCM